MATISGTSRQQKSILERLFEPLSITPTTGVYDPGSQTWSHREWLEFSPVKNNQEM